MAKKKKFSSVQEFAVEILRRNSSQRVALLREHYASLNHPDLASIVTNNFPKPDSTSAPSPLATMKTAVTKSQADPRTPQRDVLKAQQKVKSAKKNLESKTKPETPQNKGSVPQKMTTNPQNGFQEPKAKMPQKNKLEHLSHVPALESEKQQVCGGRKRTKNGSVSSSAVFGVGGGLGLDQACSSGLGSWEAAPFPNRKDRDTSSSPNLIHGRSTKLCKAAVQEREREKKTFTTSEMLQGQRENHQTPSPSGQPTSSFPSILTDIIGDTSILNDLLKPKSRGAQERGTPKTPPALSSASVNSSLTTPPPSRINLNSRSGSADIFDSLSSPKSNKPANQQLHSKTSHKDFWDILNEGNEEAINRLTDPAEVQRVCINTNFAARSRSEEEDSKSLWKSNEKFLWKK